MVSAIRSREVAESELERLIQDDIVLPGFPGIARFRAPEKSYSEAEKIVLNYFFTNIDSNVYAVKDTLPDEIWALLMGQYARGTDTARDRLLKLIHEIHKKSEKEPSLEDIAEAIIKGREVHEMLSSHIAKAGKFIEVNGIKYGHASLRDSAVVRICFEGVSQRAAKFLEMAREGAYQEQSTRAISFERKNIGIPYEIRGTKFEKLFVDLNSLQMDFYKKATERVETLFGKRYSHLRADADHRIKEGTGGLGNLISDKDWKSCLNQGALDVARVTLPQNMTTSLGITLNTRRLQDMLTEWQSSPFPEMQILGKIAQIEAKKVNPTLVKYGNRSKFYSELPDKKREIYDELVTIPPRNYGPKSISSKLIFSTPHIEDYALASILHSTRPHVDIENLKDQVSAMNFDQRRKIAKAELEGKLPYEVYPKSAEIGSFTFSRLIGIGEYRDMQRQRGDRQQVSPYGMIGYVVPDEIVEVGLYEEYVGIMAKAEQIYDILMNEGFDFAAEYIPMMGNLIRHIATMDPIQLFYMAKLRAQAAGIDGYRQIAQSEGQQGLDLMPAFRGLVNFDKDKYALGRLEETVVTRIKDERPKIV